MKKNVSKRITMTTYTFYRKKIISLNNNINKSKILENEEKCIKKNNNDNIYFYRKKIVYL